MKPKLVSACAATSSSAASRVSAVASSSDAITAAATSAAAADLETPERSHKHVLQRVSAVASSSDATTAAATSAAAADLETPERGKKRRRQSASAVASSSDATTAAAATLAAADLETPECGHKRVRQSVPTDRFCPVGPSSSNSHRCRKRTKAVSACSTKKQVDDAVQEIETGCASLRRLQGRRTGEGRRTCTHCQSRVRLFCMPACVSGCARSCACTILSVRVCVDPWLPCMHAVRHCVHV